MSGSDATAYLVQALAHAEEWGGRRTERDGWQWPTARACTVALSREAGALGTSVARAVGARLNWPVYDQELLERVSDDMQVPVRVLEGVDEKPQGWLRECMAAWSFPSDVPESAYFWRLVKVLVSLGAQGECLIVGRGAAQFLPPATTLRVRLVSDPENRIAVIRREMGLSESEAARHIETTDRERARFIRNHFRKDPTEPLNYDLILNSGRFGVDRCADLVIEALHRLQESLS